jgi:hypothetical protein
LFIAPGDQEKMRFFAQNDVSNLRLQKKQAKNVPCYRIKPSDNLKTGSFFTVKRGNVMENPEWK